MTSKRSESESESESYLQNDGGSSQRKRKRKCNDISTSTSTAVRTSTGRAYDNPNTHRPKSMPEIDVNALVRQVQERPSRSRSRSRCRRGRARTFEQMGTREEKRNNGSGGGSGGRKSKSKRWASRSRSRSRSRSQSRSRRSRSRSSGHSYERRRWSPSRSRSRSMDPERPMSPPCAPDAKDDERMHAAVASRSEGLPFANAILEMLWSAFENKYKVDRPLPVLPSRFPDSASYFSALCHLSLVDATDVCITTLRTPRSNTSRKKYTKNESSTNQHQKTHTFIEWPTVCVSNIQPWTLTPKRKKKKKKKKQKQNQQNTSALKSFANTHPDCRFLHLDVLIAANQDGRQQQELREEQLKTMAPGWLFMLTPINNSQPWLHSQSQHIFGFFDDALLTRRPDSKMFKTCPAKLVVSASAIRAIELTSLWACKNTLWQMTAVCWLSTHKRRCDVCYPEPPRALHFLPSVLVGKGKGNGKEKEGTAPPSHATPCFRNKRTFFKSVLQGEPVVIATSSTDSHTKGDPWWTDALNQEKKRLHKKRRKQWQQGEEADPKDNKSLRSEAREFTKKVDQARRDYLKKKRQEETGENSTITNTITTDSIREAFGVQPRYVGSMIGRKGTHKRKVEDATGVQILFSRHDKHFPSVPRTVTLVGPNHSAVRQAKRMLHDLARRYSVGVGHSIIILKTNSINEKQINQIKLEKGQSIKGRLKRGRTEKGTIAKIVGRAGDIQRGNLWMLDNGKLVAAATLGDAWDYVEPSAYETSIVQDREGDVLPRQVLYKSNQIYVKSVGSDISNISKQKLIDTFKQFGTVMDVNFHGNDDHSNRHCKCAFVTFADLASVHKVLANGKMITIDDDITISVEKKKRKEPMTEEEIIERLQFRLHSIGYRSMDCIGALIVLLTRRKKRDPQPGTLATIVPQRNTKKSRWRLKLEGGGCFEVNKNDGGTVWDFCDESRNRMRLEDSAKMPSSEAASASAEQELISISPASSASTGNKDGSPTLAHQQEKEKSKSASTAMQSNNSYQQIEATSFMAATLGTKATLGTSCPRVVKKIPLLPQPLYPSQRAAALAFLEAPPGALQLVQGPPGTGKTTFIIGLVSCLVLAGRRVLVTAPSNKALRLLAERFLLLTKNSKQWKIQEDKDTGTTTCTIHPRVSSIGIPEKLLDGASNAMQCTFAYHFCKNIARRVKTMRQSLQHRSRDAVSAAVKDLCEGVEVDIGHQWRKKALLDLNGKRSISFCDLFSSFNKDVSRVLAASTGPVNLYSWPLGDIFDVVEGTLKKGTPGFIAVDQLNRANVIFATCSAAGANIIRRLDRVDDMILDEAGQVVEAESCVAWNFRPSRLLCVGDPQQLSATVISERAREAGYSRSLMHRLLQDVKYPHMLLDTQYRMHPDIAAFPNARWYKGEINHAECVTMGERTGVDRTTQTRTPIPLCAVKWREAVGSPYVLVDVDGASNEQSDGSSLINAREASLARTIIKFLARFHREQQQCNVCVITFYAAQKARLEQELERCMAVPPVSVHTVDSFQGSEADIVIVSFVRSNAQYKVGFSSDYHRMNVALTRARHVCILLANTKTLVRSGSSDLISLYRDAKERKVLWSETALRQSLLQRLRDANEYRAGNASTSSGHYLEVARTRTEPAPASSSAAAARVTAKEGRGQLRRKSRAHQNRERESKRLATATEAAVEMMTARPETTSTSMVTERRGPLQRHRPPITIDMDDL